MAKSFEAKLVGIRGEYAGTSICLDEANSILEVGSNPRLSNLVLAGDKTYVADRHATIVLEDNNRVLLRDQNSRFGVYVNDGRIPAEFWVWLSKGDVINFGCRRNCFLLESVGT